MSSALTFEDNSPERSARTELAARRQAVGHAHARVRFLIGSEVNPAHSMRRRWEAEKAHAERDLAAARERLRALEAVQ